MTAPECILTLRFSAASDMYAYGMLLFELFSPTVPPFQDYTVDELLIFIREIGEMPELLVPRAMPSTLRDLTLQSVAFTPAARPSFSDAVSVLQKLVHGANASEVPYANLTKLDVLGEGQFGVVLKMSAKGIEGQPPGESTIVAVKMLRNAPSSKDQQDFLAEINLTRRLRHSNLVAFQGACTVPQTPLCLLLEFTPGGSLESWLRAKPIFIQNDWFFLVHQIVLGMRALHSYDVVHRDLATRNILMFPKLHVKISDFGLSRDMKINEEYYRLVHNNAMAIQWMAPEAMHEQIWGTTADVYSFGITVWEIYTFAAMVPFGELSTAELVKLMRSTDIQTFVTVLPLTPVFPTGIITDVLWDALMVDPRARPTFAILEAATTPEQWEKMSRPLSDFAAKKIAGATGSAASATSAAPVSTPSASLLPGKDAYVSPAVSSARPPQTLRNFQVGGTGPTAAAHCDVGVSNPSQKRSASYLKVGAGPSRVAEFKEATEATGVVESSEILRSPSFSLTADGRGLRMTRYACAYVRVLRQDGAGQGG